MNPIPPRRGHIYRVILDPEATAMLCLIITDNIHNDRATEYSSLLVTADRSVPPGLPGWVRLSAGDPAFGHAVVEPPRTVFLHELKEDLGAISMETMHTINQALKRLMGL
jgi:mRNA-degrading endonuclease toxin of MazEF toxin-antitoxin module